MRTLIHKVWVETLSDVSIYGNSNKTKSYSLHTLLLKSCEEKLLEKVESIWLKPVKLSELFGWHSLHVGLEAVVETEHWISFHRWFLTDFPHQMPWCIFQQHNCWTSVLKDAHSSLQTEKSGLKLQMGFSYPILTEQHSFCSNRNEGGFSEDVKI